MDSLIEQDILHSQLVIRALRRVPRTSFLPPEMQEYSCADTPLQVGFGQTVSAPHIVAVMNEALELEVGNRVLEVGAGCGWHAATIAEVVAPTGSPRSEWGHVYSVEIVSSLADLARKNIMNAGYGDRVTVVNGDGSRGYDEKAPFDRVVVTAAAPKIPKLLVDQLKPEGVLVVPVGSPFTFQVLLKLCKRADGAVVEENLGGVSFVPLTGAFGHRF